jgi:diacylglycerol diphosphate phosphatase/phosphatidate phosphatase
LIFFTTKGELWKFALAIIPTCFAGWIAITRTQDYKHDFADIVAGGLLGASVAICCYFLFFPSLFDTSCDKAKLR